MYHPTLVKDQFGTHFDTPLHFRAKCGFDSIDKVLTPWRQPSPPPPMGAPPVAISVGDKSRGMFPLGLGHSVHYVRKRLALIGDAAHRMHPLAGQGVNVGFNDVKVLVDVLNTSVDLGEDIGSIHQLMGYEATTQRANVPMLMATDGLKRLFSSDYGPLAFLRGVGLNATNGVEPLKTALMRHAMGL
ncbi:hypothetical protein SARC_06768 [Sphaeroforma arctica JP610]|uniref:FAD-binding domain-containing protein n=1 Tax=Sphaeroforma arctica JP610 TaxID=667725 RepID=A0A0L0FWD8_9EUKA|nr:hypothetical protein SARC_06768 [Sphaeroforma arctica JP610]KNC80886.1 hypothetical protein SARC_06768 [Sphaeroforma arctica JP610]|eukprot:XP_014154788.1 hypothetical protein SARC_06768 [Sphaeroforma arctica JP610]